VGGCVVGCGCGCVCVVGVCGGVGVGVWGGCVVCVCGVCVWCVCVCVWCVCNTFIMCYNLPIPVAARSKEWDCGRSIVGIMGSNPTSGMDIFLFCVLCVVR